MEISGVSAINRWPNHRRIQSQFVNDGRTTRKSAVKNMFTNLTLTHEVLDEPLKSNTPFLITRNSKRNKTTKIKMLRLCTANNKLKDGNLLKKPCPSLTGRRLVDKKKIYEKKYFDEL